jgi:hypothetical protein
VTESMSISTMAHPLFISWAWFEFIKISFFLYNYVSDGINSFHFNICPCLLYLSGDCKPDSIQQLVWWESIILQLIQNACNFQYKTHLNEFCEIQKAFNYILLYTWFHVIRIIFEIIKASTFVIFGVANIIFFSIYIIAVFMENAFFKKLGDLKKLLWLKMANYQILCNLDNIGPCHFSPKNSSFSTKK